MKNSKQPTAIICLSPYSGGMELDAIRLSKKLSTFVDITIIAKDNCFIANQKDEYKDIKLETISFKSSLSISIIRNARKIINKYNIKNVIFFGASELKSLYLAFLGLDINLIVRHGTTKSTPKKDWFHRLIYSRVNYHVSICKHLLKNVRTIIPFGENTKEKLIYSSFDFKTPINIKQDKLTILHIGRIAEGKGQIDAIKACEVLVENDIEFVFYIVGGYDKGYEDKFLRFYDNCSYKNKIKLVGFTKNIEQYLSKSDIFLFPSYGEGLSNSFLEALSYNLICISYDNTSFPEFKELGFKFFMAKDRDVEDISKKLYDISLNIDDYKLKTNKNYTLAKLEFSLEKEMLEYKKILK